MEYAVVNKNEAGLVPYPYVYVLHDGSARELTQDEKKYLETPFHPADGARPYIKESYLSKNGRGDIKGFCPRYKLPGNVRIIR